MKLADEIAREIFPELPGRNAERRAFRDEAVAEYSKIIAAKLEPVRANLAKLSIFVVSAAYDCSISSMDRHSKIRKSLEEALELIPALLATFKKGS